MGPCEKIPEVLTGQKKTILNLFPEVVIKQARRREGGFGSQEGDSSPLSLSDSVSR